MRSLCALLALLACGPLKAAEADCPSGSERMALGASVLCVSMDASQAARQKPVLDEWVTRSARIVAAYYDGFPVKRVLVKLHAMPGSGVGGGRTTNEPLVISLRVGLDSSPAELMDDWVLVHEMVHLALPEVGQARNWLAEGLATYVEGVARAQAGNRAVGDVWAEDRHSMPAGLPRGGEGGMDETPSWGRTYWGGALFCLQADIAIRQKTQNKIGLQTALRAIAHGTRGYDEERPIEEVLAIGDAATGTHVLQDMYQKMRRTPMMTDLDALWKELGVPEDPHNQPFDDKAPLAAIRAAITSRPSVL